MNKGFDQLSQSTTVPRNKIILEPLDRNNLSKTNINDYNQSVGFLVPNLDYSDSHASKS